MNTEKGSVGVVYADVQICWSMSAFQGRFSVSAMATTILRVEAADSSRRGVSRNWLDLCHVVSASTYSMWCETAGVHGTRNDPGVGRIVQRCRIVY
jgi:hypothetical protein